MHYSQSPHYSQKQLLPSAVPHDTVNLRWFTEGLWNHSVWELFIPVLRSLPPSCLERRRGHMWREKKSSFLQIILNKLEQDPILEGEYSPQINQHSYYSQSYSRYLWITGWHCFVSSIKWDLFNKHNCDKL